MVLNLIMQLIGFLIPLVSYAGTFLSYSTGVVQAFMGLMGAVAQWIINVP